MKLLKTKEMILCGLFAALMAVGANVSPFFTIGGVPITLQLMFAILAGGILGSRLGAIAMSVYMFIGLAGAPVFAQFKGGPAQLLSPTFGFIVSFIIVAYICGKLIGDKVDVSKGTYVLTGVLSIFFNYIIGTNFMFVALKVWAEAPEGFNYAMAWVWMAAYLPLDIVVTIVSLSIVPRLSKAINRVYSTQEVVN
ncbi:biotin transporter BioY [Bacillus solimangrovi]|uniref:Biotin transporter n=1 Tax=Bacillus solimangrovi TaxID=1305675 RepID=A0A1E5LB48_9BACI|nr:biotin transporter BioY [Bacillus solimangrovi]OEH91312.1 BioY family transporter [Bacillus solimangrovi]